LGFGAGPGVITEEYDGSTWTAGGNLNTARSNLGGAGTQTSAIGFGGELPPGSVSSATELYDGTAWSSAIPMGTARYQFGSAGTQNAGLGFGGRSPASTATEEWTLGSSAAGTASTLTTS